VTNKNRSTIEPADSGVENEALDTNPVENEAPVDHNESDTGNDAKDENETGIGAEDKSSYDAVNNNNREGSDCQNNL
jgi:hypothetical protein